MSGRSSHGVADPGSALRRAGEAHSGKTALVCAGRSWTFAELLRESTRAAAALVSDQPSASYSIASWSPNAAEAIIVQWAALLIGAQTIHLDPSWEASQASAVLRDKRIDCLFARAFHRGRQYPALVKSIRAECPRLRKVVTHGREPRFERVLRGGWCDFLESGAAELSCASTRPASPSIIEVFDRPYPEEQGAAGAIDITAQDLRGRAAARPICVAIPCWQPTGLGVVLRAQLDGRTVVLVSEDADPLEIDHAARRTGCALALVAPAKARAARAAGHEDEDLCWVSETACLTKSVETMAQDAGLVFRSLSSGASSG